MASDENIASGESPPVSERRPPVAMPPPSPIAAGEFYELHGGLSQGLSEEDRKMQLNAFERLFSTYAGKEVQRVANKYPGLPDDMVIDAVSDSFLALWRDVSEMGWNDRWSWAYLRKTANNLAYRAHKKLVFRSRFVVVPSKREAHDSEEDSLLDPEVMARRNPVLAAAEDGEIRRFADNQELMERVNEAIAGFPPRLQSVARIMASNYHMKLTPETLLVLYFDAHGEMLKIGAATKALAAVRGRLEEVLVRYRKQSDPQ